MKRADVWITPGGPEGRLEAVGLLKTTPVKGPVVPVARAIALPMQHRPPSAPVSPPVHTKRRSIQARTERATLRARIVPTLPSSPTACQRWAASSRWKARRDMSRKLTTPACPQFSQSEHVTSPHHGISSSASAACLTSGGNSMFIDTSWSKNRVSMKCPGATIACRRR